MIDWLAIFAFAVFSIFTILAIFYFPAAFIENDGRFGIKVKRK